MFSELIESYVKDLPSDQQDACIEAFFDNNQSFWDQVGITNDGSDDSSDRMINYVLNNYRMELPTHIIKMLEDWKETGF